MRKTSLVLVLLFCLMAATSVFADTVVDTINPSLTPCVGCSWAANWEAWTYTPAISYSLTDVETKWAAAGNSGTVGVGIYSGFANGPTGLLGSSTMFANNDGSSWSTASFSPISIAAGNTYYILFSGTSGIGANVTSTGPGAITPYNFSYDNSNWYYWGGAYGMFQFSSSGSSVPEPGSMVLLGSGLIGLAGFLRRKIQPEVD
jgi:hypothetical protein